MGEHAYVHVCVYMAVCILVCVCMWVGGRAGARVDVCFYVNVYTFKNSKITKKTDFFIHTCSRCSCNCLQYAVNLK